jgi:preprotein translocase subunit YajC
MVFASSCAASTTTNADGTTGTAASSSSSLFIMLALIVVLFGMMYFFTIRPQQKKQKEAQKMLSELAVGDKVITNAGIYGVIKTVYQDSFVLTTDSGALRVAKWAVVGKQPEDAPAHE